MQTNHALQGFLACLEEIGERSEQRHGLTSTLLEDWNRVYLVWSDHMRIEASGRGYDFKAGREAQREFLAEAAAFEEKHGVKFDAYAKPEGL